MFLRVCKTLLRPHSQVGLRHWTANPRTWVRIPLGSFYFKKESWLTMDFEKQESKKFDKQMKDSKSFIVAHTEYYEPEYSNSV